MYTLSFWCLSKSYLFLVPNLCLQRVLKAIAVEKISRACHVSCTVEFFKGSLWSVVKSLSLIIVLFLRATKRTEIPKQAATVKNPPATKNAK